MSLKDLFHCIELNQNSRINLLRELPETSNVYYIEREFYIDLIVDYLKKMNENEEDGQILVHGMAGCGKTVIVSQSVRRAVKQYHCFSSAGVYWVKIGKNFQTFHLTCNGKGKISIS